MYSCKGWLQPGSLGYAHKGWLQLGELVCTAVRTVFRLKSCVCTVAKPDRSLEGWYVWPQGRLPARRAVCMVAGSVFSLEGWYVWAQGWLSARRAVSVWSQVLTAASSAGMFDHRGRLQTGGLVCMAAMVGRSLQCCLCMPHGLPAGLVSQLIEPVCKAMMGANTLIGWLKKTTAWRAKHIAVMGRRKCQWSYEPLGGQLRPRVQTAVCEQIKWSPPEELVS